MPYSHLAQNPHIADTAWVAPSVELIGDVSLGESSSIWYAVVVRADTETISIGAGSNIQDGSVLHADPGIPLQVGDQVTVGHRVVLHGCTIADQVLVGMGAIVMNRARIGAGSIIGAGAVVTQGTEVPPGSLVLGAPAKVVRQISAAEREAIIANADRYRQHAAAHRDAISGV